MLKHDQVLKKEAHNLISAASHTEIDYLHLVSPLTLQEQEQLSNQVTCAMAVCVGKTRLIDNRTYSI